MTTNLTEVAPGVLVATSRFMVTTTTVLVAGSDALVIDPGVHADELAGLAEDLAARGLRVVGGVATHAHWDHVLWHGDLGEVPRWASPATVSQTTTHRDDLLADAARTTPVDEGCFGHLEPAEEIVPWDGPEVRLVVHDAHQHGHTALHVPSLGLLVAGDMGSDVEVPLLEHGVAGPDALAVYHEGVDRLASLDPVDVVVTGHGHACDGATWRRRLEADRRYLDALAAGRPSDDRRLLEPWLREADAGMRDVLSKPAWRRWVRELPPPDADVPAVRASLSAFLGSSPGTVAGYVALPGEVDVTDLLSAFRRPDRTALPRLTDDGEITWHRDDGVLHPHRLGMLQPGPDAPEVRVEDLDVVLVPGRAFDVHGIRLGRGGGHYDRLIPRLRPGTPVIGVTVDRRVVRRLPTEPHDAPMTHLATESGVRAVS